MSQTNMSKSAFSELGFKETIRLLKEEIQSLYLSDYIPWVIGYSGGKDSTAITQLIWIALSALPPEKLTKPVNVISTDTLVENPIVAAWVIHSLEKINKSAKAYGLPISSHRLTPKVSDTFWVNLIGRGYPAPRPKFRWCTDRLKIRPANKFITDVVKENGEAILILGTRKAESQVRQRTMEKYEQQRVRERLNQSPTLNNCLIFSPIENWSNDDVWTFLMQIENPWGHNNKELLTMYKGASQDGECPLVVDSDTPSCGSSRFGCWVCTLVDKDRSMQAMIQNDEEKEWMLPLLELRNELDIKDDRHLRDFRRMSGAVQLINGRAIHGPYLQSARENWLRNVLTVQTELRKHGPDYVRDLELITLAELNEIRKIWVVDKHELEDNLPKIYEECTGDKFSGSQVNENALFGNREMQILKQVCDNDTLQFQMVRELLDVERRHQTMARRAGLYEALEGAIKRNFFEDEDDAVNRMTKRQEAIIEANSTLF